ncbi:hypothetical protein EDEG_03373 [Edhazardia aedis USNM 41457]|uniref:Uncharacterized protein n=1 Tax=Edhazardia aedis (strain USNM 41457) TaxID=1003232 RepID=J9DLE2_EDHAE|nr:hypothetical protein EDEG_03373 [Edhazardia aedis USNM 41457]|eukprot:EJW02177.1 hypothetical protein EDEG_03373 [Edhazardia aedis USNM 41457]
MNSFLKQNEDYKFSDPVLIDSDFLLLAYGNTRKNLHQDFIGTSKNRHILKILTCSANSKTIESEERTFDKEIVSVISCDFDRSGESSYIITFKNPEDEHLFDVVHFKKSNNSINLLSSGDRIPFLYSTDEWNCTILIQNNLETRIFYYDKDKLCDKKIDFPRLSIDHSSAFVDINGDLRPDLALIIEESGQKYLSLQISDKFDDSKIAQKIKLVGKTGPIVYADFNGNGLIDCAFVSSINDEYYLNVYLNKNNEILTKIDRSKNINDQTTKKESVEYGTFDEKKQYFYDNDPKFYKKIRLNDIFPNLTPVLQMNPVITGTNLPCGIMAADINLNSYTDIFILFKDTNDEIQFRILENMFWDNGTFRPMKYQPDHIPGILSVSVCDFTTEFKESLIVNNYYNGKFQLRYMENNYAKNRCRLTVTVLQPDSELKTYSSIVPGISCNYYIEETGALRASTAVSQSSFLHLQRPMCVIGLGSLSYSGDILSIGGPRTSNDLVHNHVMDVKNKILPNSDLVIRPFKKAFRVELFLKVGEHVLHIVIVFMIVFLINIIFVFVGHRLENAEKEDESKKIGCNFYICCIIKQIFIVFIF